MCHGPTDFKTHLLGFESLENFQAVWLLIQKENLLILVICVEVLTFVISHWQIVTDWICILCSTGFYLHLLKKLRFITLPLKKPYKFLGNLCLKEMLDQIITLPLLGDARLPPFSNRKVRKWNPKINYFPCSCISPPVSTMLSGTLLAHISLS